MIVKLQPVFKDYLWGGVTLAKQYGFMDKHIAESWIMSTLPGDENKIIGKNKNLNELFLEDKNIAGKNYQGNFPLLLKTIDAEKDLSIQNHPAGKTEFWHILSAKPGAFVYLGLNKELTKDELREILKEGKITDYLNKVFVKPGDCLLIRPGTIHAIGAGIYLAEIQQNLNVTYRLYDFDRVDANGNKRELHIDKAVEVASLVKYDVTNIKNITEGEIVKCEFFKCIRHKLDGEISYNADETSLHHINVLNGEGQIISKNEIVNIKKNDSILITAGQGKYLIKGKLEYIQTTK